MTTLFSDFRFQPDPTRTRTPNPNLFGRLTGSKISTRTRTSNPTRTRTRHLYIVGVRGAQKNRLTEKPKKKTETGFGETGLKKNRIGFFKNRFLDRFGILGVTGFFTGSKTGLNRLGKKPVFRPV